MKVLGHEVARVGRAEVAEMAGREGEGEVADEVARLQQGQDLVAAGGGEYDAPVDDIVL